MMFSPFLTLSTGLMTVNASDKMKENAEEKM